MKEARYFYVPDAAHAGELPEEEAKHAVRVLRLQSGDRLFLVDGEGGLFEAEVTMASGKHCMYSIVNTLHYQKEWQGRICLAIAPTKMMDRIEWMAEKATEIGFDEIGFLNCKFSERKTIRTDRIEKIVVSAMKQSHKAGKPTVCEMTDFKKYIDANTSGHRFIAHCYDEVERTDLYGELQKISPDETVTVLIGPEGDFAIDEVEYAVSKGYKSISLGRSRLRTETAGLCAVQMANLAKRVM
jgi:16S rRNA (uracil1498-N3)-methyltransferase